MGGKFSKIFLKDFKERRVLVIGLEGAGKTSIINHLRNCNGFKTYTNNMGFKLQSIEYKEFKFILWNISNEIRLWRYYFPQIAAVICVIDAANQANFPTAYNHLHNMLNQRELNNVVVLVLANKQDEEKALNVNEMVDKFELYRLQQSWQIRGTSSLKGNGIYEILEYLRQMLQLQEIVEK